METIVVAGGRLFMKYPSLQGLEQRAARMGARVVAIRDEQESAFADAITEAVAVVVIARRVDAAALASMRRCRIVQTLSVGHDCVDVAAATRAGIAVSNTPAYCTDEVASHAITLVIAVARRLHQLIPATRAGTWDHHAARPIRAFAGATLGIVGLGRIGRRVAAMARGLGMRVTACDPYLADDVFALVGAERRHELADLVREADYVTIHAPLTAETRHLFDASTLALLRPQAVLVNTARGGLVDETALAAALEARAIAGAGIDVLEREPPAPDHPLLVSPYCLVTPHIAWYSEASLARGLEDGLDELERALRGERPRFVVNPEVLDRGRAMGPR
jgi:D-3-phosphoglycerate dehydrogenase / 2-oxoglutarate reductase